MPLPSASPRQSQTVSVPSTGGGTGAGEVGAGRVEAGGIATDRLTAACPPPVVDLPVAPVASPAKPRRPKRKRGDKAEKITAEAFQALSNDEILSLLLSLPRSRRQGLMAALEQFHALELESMTAMERESLQEQGTQSSKGRGRAARFEDKLINGCGPYRYFRWWDGTHHRSTYIGKVPAMGG